jgi:hypothetical protein
VIQQGQERRVLATPVEICELLTTLADPPTAAFCVLLKHSGWGILPTVGVLDIGEEVIEFRSFDKKHSFHVSPAEVTAQDGMNGFSLIFSNGERDKASRCVGVQIGGKHPSDKEIVETIQRAWAGDSPVVSGRNSTSSKIK